MAFTEGRHTVKLLDYGVGVTKNDKEFVWATFGNETEDTITWKGWLTTDKAKERTKRDLQTLGINEEKADLLGEGVSSAILDSKSNYDIVVVEDLYNDQKSLKVQNIFRSRKQPNSEGKKVSVSSLFQEPSDQVF